MVSILHSAIAFASLDVELTGKRRPVDGKLGCMYPRHRMQDAASVTAQLSSSFGPLGSCNCFIDWIPQLLDDDH